MMTTLSKVKGRIPLLLGDVLEQRGIKNTHFAKAADIEYHAIGRMEKDMWQRIGLDTLYSLCVALKMQPGELLGKIDFEEYERLYGRGEFWPEEET